MIVQNDEPQIGISRLTSFSNNERYNPMFLWLFKMVDKIKYGIVTFWIISLIWGLATGFRYFGMARDEMSAPEGSRSYNDNQKFIELFPEQASDGPLIIFIQCKHQNCSLVCPRDTCTKLGSKCGSQNDDIMAFTKQITDSVLAYSKEHHVGYSDTVMSYYEFSGTSLDTLKCQFASTTGKETFILFSGSQDVKSELRYDLLDHLLHKFIPEANPNPAMYKVGVTGTDPMIRDGSVAAAQQAEVIDAVTMPFAFALLAYMVRSWRLLLVSLFNMSISIMSAMAVLAVLTDEIGKAPLTTTTSFVEVLGLSMSVDYSLFLLRRFRDEVRGGRDPYTSIKIMMSQAGHVVMMSSLTIICVFGGFVFMKSTDLMVQGLACVVTVMMCLLVNMTNTPALLLIFPDFFSKFYFEKTPKKQSGWCPGNVCSRNQEPSGDDNRTSESLLEPTENSATVVALRERGGPYKGFYFRILLFITKWPYNILTLVGIYALFVPLASQALRLERNQNLLQGIPRDASSAIVYKDMLKSFPGGTLSPMYMVVEATSKKANSVLNLKMFQQVKALTHHVAEKTQSNLTSFNSIASFQGVEGMAAFSVATFCHQFPKQKKCAPYNFLWKQSVNTQGNSLLIFVSVEFDPFTNRIETFVKDVYKSIDEFMGTSSKHKHDAIQGVYFSGIEVGMVEDMAISFDEFPFLVAITCVVVFVLLGVMLKSAFVVIRLTLTVILPLASVFGLAVLVYQDGILDWLNISAVHSSQDGFFWYVPLLCFTICCGLALDYDVFVIARIREHRVSGYEIRAAIIKSMWEINTTVICAGMIMSIAFGGLLLGNSICVNQMAWILTTSVLFDTFLVQCIVVPCIMSFFDGWSWWPGHVPTSNLVTLQEEIDSRNRAFSRFGVSPTILENYERFYTVDDQEQGIFDS